MKTIKVTIKNKPNEIKAVKYLGKFSQHKPLLNEVVKTLDFLEENRQDEKRGLYPQHEDISN